MTYEAYNSLDGEQNHVHVEVPYDHLDGKFGHMTRIAPHGVDKIIEDHGWWYGGTEWKSTARFIFDWGNGPVVEILAGKVIKDER